MNITLATGLFLVLVSVLNILDATRRKGEPFEFAGALFIGELGLMFVVNQVLPMGEAAIFVTLAFGVSLLVTFVFWMKLIRRYKNRTGG